MGIQLERFLLAQEHSYQSALTEIRAGKKISHWMWYVFPQLDGLGHSETAKHYALSGFDEAEAYLAHPILGKRLIEITSALLKLETNDPIKVMGTPDDLKLCSCMTLFGFLKDSDSVFKKVLEKFFDGRADELTLALAKKGD